jgi:hypothetical protein
MSSAGSCLHWALVIQITQGSGNELSSCRCSNTTIKRAECDWLDWLLVSLDLTAAPKTWQCNVKTCARRPHSFSGARTSTFPLGTKTLADLHISPVFFGCRTAMPRESL